MNKGTLLLILLLVGLFALSVIYERWIFNAVMGADIPGWLKYLLLK